MIAHLKKGSSDRTKNNGRNMIRRFLLSILGLCVLLVGSAGCVSTPNSTPEHKIEYTLQNFYQDMKDLYQKYRDSSVVLASLKTEEIQIGNEGNLYQSLEFSVNPQTFSSFAGYETIEHDEDGSFGKLWISMICDATKVDNTIYGRLYLKLSGVEEVDNVEKILDHYGVEHEFYEGDQRWSWDIKFNFDKLFEANVLTEKSKKKLKLSIDDADLDNAIVDVLGSQNKNTISVEDKDQYGNLELYRKYNFSLKNYTYDASIEFFQITLPTSKLENIAKDNDYSGIILTKLNTFTLDSSWLGYMEYVEYEDKDSSYTYSIDLELNSLEEVKNKISEIDALNGKGFLEAISVVETEYSSFTGLKDLIDKVSK